MRAFAAMLDRLSLTGGRNAKLTLIGDYLRATPDPDRGYALGALTGDLVFTDAKPAMIRAAIESRMDPVLFGWSYDYVGDLAEAVALAWPSPLHPGSGAVPLPLSAGEAVREPPTGEHGRNDAAPSLSEVVETLRSTSRAGVPRLLEGWLDALDATGRWALLKLLTRELRVGINARLAKAAAAAVSEGRTHKAGEPEPEPITASDVEEVWHAVAPPYPELFAWLEGRGERPRADFAGRFRPVMLSVALDEEADFAKLDPSHYAAEWKWDGIRVQAVHEDGVRRLYSRTGEDISRSFPDVLEALDFEGAVDGELLVIRNGEVAPFADLQQRLNRKSVDAKALAAYPAAIRAYDILADGGADTRPLPFRERRAQLEAFVARSNSSHIDLSPLVPFERWEDLAALRADPAALGAQAGAVEGVMLKRWDSAYVSGRPKGPWFKWKRDPHLVDAVLMYAQRGHGKRSSFYSDYTFGVWDAEGRLTPVGKAYGGYTDAELLLIDKFVRDHTVERFGPVRAVRAGRDFGLVLEVAFEGLQRSTRHKSGVAMRFPRISRLRWDKPAAEADTLEVLEGLLQRMETHGRA
ncbi:MAG: cisplatin damage response ATP-dependent DNA ligase [Proteobacteria bacterium]|nr:cisplatin damage response ATP-dependent DNA ligase [Pseudomonadota bacterium]